MTEASDTEWSDVSTPVSSTLYAVERARRGVLAVGGGGTVLVRRDGEWTTADTDGPGDAGNSLYAAASTDDGRRVWFGGASGALGYYDVASDDVVDHSAPEGVTGSWRAITVTGNAGEEKVLVANGSAEVLSGAVSDGPPPTVDWVHAARSAGGDGLGSGSSVHSIVTGPDGPYATNSSGGIFYARDGRWSRTGIEAAQSTLYDLYVDEALTLAVGANGYVYRDVDSSWVATDVVDDPLYSVSRDDERLVTVGGNGRLFRRRAPGEWEAVELPVDEPLRDLELRTDPAFAVGEDGTVLERPAVDETGERDETARKSVSEPESQTGESEQQTDE